jgi:hypothetical protein
MCLTIARLRQDSVDNFAHVPAGAHGHPANFAGGGVGPAQRPRRNGRHHAQFFIFLMYIRPIKTGVFYGHKQLGACGSKYIGFNAWLYARPQPNATNAGSWPINKWQLTEFAAIPTTLARIE